LAKQLRPLDLQLSLSYSSAHEFCDNRALILIAKSLVELRLYLIGDTEINGGHEPSPLLKSSTMEIYALLELGQYRFLPIFARFRVLRQFDRPNGSFTDAT
jgi:hypothetical protein